MNENSSRFRQLDAEVRGFPLTSIHAFRYCYHSIPEQPKDRDDNSSAADFFTASESLGERYGLTINEFEQFRDFTRWSGIDSATNARGSRPSAISLADYFKELANSTLEIDGDSLRPRLRPEVRLTNKTDC